MPGPSDWDVRLVATVPADEFSAWIPNGVTSAPTANTDWLKSVPTTLDLSGIHEWYVESKRVVGVDRGQRIITYRVCSTPIP